MTTTAIAAPTRTVQLVELGQTSRHPDSLSEDAVSVLRHRVAVLDGVSSLRPSIEGSLLSPGLAAVRAVVAALEDPTLRPDVPAAELVQLMHTAVAEIAPYSADVGDTTPPACAVAVLDAAAGHIVRVGDIHVVVDEIHHPPQRNLDETLAAHRALLLRDYLALGCPVDAMRTLDPGRHHITAAIEDARRLWNKTADGLGVGRIDGTHTPDALIEVIDIGSATEVILATDGYIDPRPTLDESEQLLAARIAADPLMIDSPAQTKGVCIGGNSFDDRVYLRVRLVPES